MTTAPVFVLCLSLTISALLNLWLHLATNARLTKIEARLRADLNPDRAGSSVEPDWDVLPADWIHPGTGR